MKANAAREAAPKTAPMATRANAPAERWAAGKSLIHSHGKYSAQGGARHEHGREQAARRSRTQRNYQGHGLGHHHHDQHLQCEIGIQNVADGVIADAQHPGNEVSDNAQPQSPDRGPPEFVDGQLLEQVFGPVKQLAEAHRRQAANHSQHQVKRQGAGDAEIHGRNREHRARAQQLHVNGGGQGAGNDQRNKRSRLELKEQQLDGKNHARNGRIEGRGHARGRATGQQHLALRRCSVKDLPYQRSHGASGLNDGTFRAEGAAGSNRDGGRNGLENRHSRLNAAAIEQHRFHGLGNAVSPDFRRPILRHDSDDESADDRNRDDPQPQMIVTSAGKVGHKAAVEGNVGQQSDQPVQKKRDTAGNQANRRRQERDQHHAELGRLGQSCVANLCARGRDRWTGLRPAPSPEISRVQFVTSNLLLRIAWRSFGRQGLSTLGRPHRPFQGRDQCRALGAQLGFVPHGQFAKHLFAFRSKPQQDLTTVLPGTASPHQASGGKAVHQFNCAVVLKLQPLGQLSDGRGAARPAVP